MKHFVSRVLAIGLTGSLLFTGCASESVSSVGTSANESVSSSSESQHDRLPLRFTQTLQRTARTRQKSRLSRICTLGLRSTWLRCLPALQTACER